METSRVQALGENCFAVLKHFFFCAKLRWLRQLRLKGRLFSNICLNMRIPQHPVTSTVSRACCCPKTCRYLQGLSTNSLSPSRPSSYLRTLFITPSRALDHIRSLPLPLDLAYHRLQALPRPPEPAYRLLGGGDRRRCSWQ